MGKVLTHEPIANGVLNVGWCSATNSCQVWEHQLVNTEEVLVLLTQRLEGDYNALAPKMRRAYKQADIEPRIHLNVFFQSSMAHSSSLRKGFSVLVAFSLKLRRRSGRRSRWLSLQLSFRKSRSRFMAYPLVQHTVNALSNFGQLRFMLRHLDPDFQSSLERTVPPLDISMITAFKAALAKHSKEVGYHFAVK